MNKFAIYMVQGLVGTGIEKLSFSHGFVWIDSGLPISRRMPENPFYFIYDLDSATMEFKPFFDRPENMKVFAIKKEYVSADIKFPDHPTISLLTQILKKFGRDQTEKMEAREAKRIPKSVPNVRAPVRIKRKGDGDWTSDPMTVLSDYLASQEKK